jgi:hypothetical protein
MLPGVKIAVMTETQPGAAAARSPFPQARWKFERTGQGASLLLWTGAEPGTGEEPARIPMSEAEAWHIISQWDRVMSYAVQSAEGTFTNGPDPAQAAGQLRVGRYIVTSPDNAVHTRLVQATPWANWVEQQSGDADGIRWLVDVFGVDDRQFLQAALAHGVQVTSADHELPG